MKCLSLWQPWASLVAWGNKRVETRSWATAYRGELAIHASKRWTRDLIETCHDSPFSERILQHGSPASLPRGAVVAVVQLIAVRRTEEVEPRLDDEEVDFGDYTPGRFAWFLGDARPLVEPYPLRGHQGLFDLSPLDTSAIERLVSPAPHPDGQGVGA